MTRRSIPPALVILFFSLIALGILANFFIISFLDNDVPAQEDEFRIVR